MGLFHLLANADITIFKETFNISLSWVGDIIKWLITGVGSVGVGIILFSLILKVIVLPFDVFQRVTMRKQNIKMKENQEKMEKLQKQYANDKNMYQQKVMEMYKQSGMSMFSSCLPMILSLVIFIVAINGFNAYSQYANVENYNAMVEAYSAKVQTYCVDEDDVKTYTYENGVIKVDAADKYIYYTIPATADYSASSQAELATAVQNYDGEISYFVKSSISADFEEKAAIEAYVGDRVGDEASQAVKAYIQGKAQDEVVKVYDEEISSRTKFIWIKNVWVTDASYKSPVVKDANEFITSMSREDFDVNGEDVGAPQISAHTNAYNDYVYDEVTRKLTTAKDASNGYFVLIALSIGTILLQQLVTMRSQKEQQKYSSVDGQGASQQKMMLIMMTGMFAIFSFMYSSAFSIYMITSNIFSLVSTLVINKIVDVVAYKKEVKAMQDKYNQRFPGRVAPSDKKNGKKSK